MWKLHRFWYRVSGGRIGAKVAGLPVLRLTTMGRTSGKARDVMLTYLDDPRGFVVIASNAGDQRRSCVVAATFKRIRVPSVRIGRKTYAVRMRQLEGDEREQAWQRVVAAFDGYAKYAASTTRTIPVALLDGGHADQLTGRITWDPSASRSTASCTSPFDDTRLPPCDRRRSIHLGHASARLGHDHDERREVPLPELGFDHDLRGAPRDQHVSPEVAEPPVPPRAVHEVQEPFVLGRSGPRARRRRRRPCPRPSSRRPRRASARRSRSPLRPAPRRSARPARARSPGPGRTRRRP